MIVCLQLSLPFSLANPSTFIACTRGWFFYEAVSKSRLGLADAPVKTDSFTAIFNAVQIQLDKSGIL
jgi:hypothetical protein